ncbi:MAG: DUF4268 domain-containing protein [Shimia sp.]
MRAAGHERWATISPSRDHWLVSSLGIAGCSLVLIFLRHEVRVELQINRSDQAENKRLFDRLAERRSVLDAAFGDDLEWRRMDDKKISIVSCKQPAQGYSKENWPEMIAWLVDRYARMESTLADPMREAAAADAGAGR